MEMSANRRVEFNINEVKRNAYYRMETTALEMNGTIFGGYVRDTMISEHFTMEYNDSLRVKKERFNNKKFWDSENEPETAARTLIPSDIDIYFPNTEDANRFIKKLKEICGLQHIDMTVDVNNKDSCNTCNKYGRLLNVRSINLIMQVGKIPFVYDGFMICIDIDVVTPRYNTIHEPPFCNLDFLCNGFIKTIHGITYSRCTGTYLDSLSEFKRTLEIVKIQQDMLQFKTNFCRFNAMAQKKMQGNKFAKNRYALKRIDKLLKKETFPWTICNLPFEITRTPADKIGETCCICEEDFTNKDILAISSLKTDDAQMHACNMHKSCLMSYLNHQEKDAFFYESTEYESFAFKCPYRNPIDFTKCTLPTM